MSSEQPLLPGAVQPESDAPSWQMERISLVETFLDQTWELTKLLLERGMPPQYALQRAYFGVYNVALHSALLLRLEIDELLDAKREALSGVRLPHSNTAVLTQRLIILTNPPARPGERTGDAQTAFALCRQLQKYRRVADYMGCEKINKATAELLVEQAKDLTDKIWRYTRANCN